MKKTCIIGTEFTNQNCYSIEECSLTVTLLHRKISFYHFNSSPSEFYISNHLISCMLPKVLNDHTSILRFESFFCSFYIILLFFQHKMKYYICILTEIYANINLWWLSGKESDCQWIRCRFNPWVRKIPWRRKWQPTPVFFPGKSHGQRSLVA